MDCVVVRLDEYRRPRGERQPEPPADESARIHALEMIVLHGWLPPRAFAREVERAARRYEEPVASRWAQWVWRLYEEGR